MIIFICLYLLSCLIMFCSFTAVYIYTIRINRDSFSFEDVLGIVACTFIPLLGTAGFCHYILYMTISGTIEDKITNFIRGKK